MRIKKNQYEQTQNESYTWFKKLPTFTYGNKKKVLLRKLGNYNGDTMIHWREPKVNTPQKTLILTHDKVREFHFA